MRLQRLQELLRHDMGVIALVAHGRQSRQAARDASPFAQDSIPVGVGPNPAGRAERSLSDEERRGATAGAGVRGDSRQLVGREAEELCGGPEGGHRSSGGSDDEQMATSLSSLCTAPFAIPFYGPLERPPGREWEKSGADIWCRAHRAGTDIAPLACTIKSNRALFTSSPLTTFHTRRMDAHVAFGNFFSGARLGGRLGKGKCRRHRPPGKRDSPRTRHLWRAWAGGQASLDCLSGAGAVATVRAREDPGPMNCHRRRSDAESGSARACCCENRCPCGRRLGLRDAGRRQRATS